MSHPSTRPWLPFGMNKSETVLCCVCHVCRKRTERWPFVLSVVVVVIVVIVVGLVSSMHIVLLNIHGNCMANTSPCCIVVVDAASSSSSVCGLQPPTRLLLEEMPPFGMLFAVAVISVGGRKRSGGEETRSLVAEFCHLAANSATTTTKDKTR